MRNVLIFLMLVIGPMIGRTQSPYNFSLKKDAPIIAVGGIAYGLGIGLNGSIEPLTELEISLLDPQNVNGFDRFATNFYSIPASNASDVLQYISYSLPLLYAIPNKTRREWLHIGVLYAETLLVTQGLTLVTKNISKRTRPYVYHEEATLSEKLTTNARLSFFSGHTSSSTASCFFTAKIFSDFFPDSEFKPIIWGLAASIPAATGILRIYSGKHFLTDVLVGYIIGGSAGILVPHFHKKARKAGSNDVSIRVVPTPQGGLLHMTF